MGRRRALPVLLAVLCSLGAAACGHGGTDDSHGRAALDGIAPLTGLPATDSAAESRPALYVKIENSPEARPQSGLEAADVVYEAVVEGGITRFAAVFQSTDPGEMGPIRSVRPQDPDLAAPLHGLAVYSGGIPDFVTAIRGVAQDLSADTIGEGAPYRRTTDRRAPHNLYGSAAGFWAKAASSDAEPPALFAYGAMPAGAAPAKTATIGFSPVASVRWSWDGTAWRRSQGGRPFTVTGAGRIGPANVLVQFVSVSNSGYIDPAGNPVPASSVVGAGKAELLRGGQVVQGTWSKPDRDSVTEFTDASGNQLTLQAGRTWVELVPVGRTVTLTP